MYTPPKFKLGHDDAWRVITEAGAGFFVRSTPSGPASVFVPIVVEDDGRTLSTHVARANDWWRDADGTDVLVLALAASAYVSPLYYPSRLEDPAVVPTWNYVAAEVRGVVRIHDDPEWARAQVERQTTRFELPAPNPWRVTDAPADYIARQVRAIVGVSVEVRSIEGKAKLSQNRPDVDHDAVRDALAAGSLADQQVARRMGNA